jgi:hypothetical protein
LNSLPQGFLNMFQLPEGIFQLLGLGSQHQGQRPIFAFKSLHVIAQW